MLLTRQYREAEVKISINLFRAHKYIVDIHICGNLNWERVLACCCWWCFISMCILYIKFYQNRFGKYYAKQAFVLMMCWEFIGTERDDAKIINTNVSCILNNLCRVSHWMQLQNVPCICMLKGVNLHFWFTKKECVIVRSKNSF